MAGRPPLLSSDARRTLVHHAAVDEFAALGFAGATVDAIAKRSGVTKPVIYREFGSKSELFAAVIERNGRENAEAALNAFAAATGTPAERLTAMIDAWFARVEANPAAFRLSTREIPDDPIVHKQAAALHTMQVANDVRLLKALAPDVPSHLHEPLGEVLNGALVTLATWWLDHPGVPRAVPVESMVRVCNGLSSGSRPAPAPAPTKKPGRGRTPR